MPGYILYTRKTIKQALSMFYTLLYNNQINARTLIGRSAMVYCVGKPMEKSRVLRIIT